MKCTIENYFMDETTQEHKKKYLILVIYDIVENKKRMKLVKYLEGYGFRVQKSAFEAKLTKNKYEELIRGIGRFAGKEDSIRVYKLNGYGEVRNWGIQRTIMDEDVILI
jgi:CRISPR-associated protein Cas2